MRSLAQQHYEFTRGQAARIEELAEEFLISGAFMRDLSVVVMPVTFHTYDVKVYRGQASSMTAAVQPIRMR